MGPGTSFPKRRFAAITLISAGFFLLLTHTSHAVNPAVVSSPFFYTFNDPGTLPEAGSMIETGSPYWWVDSGAYLKLYGYTGHTNQGSLATLDPWRLIYALNNPVDTDDGYHPQNIFRLLTTSRWQNLREQSYFLINQVNVSASPNRNQSNGLLLFSRYGDHDDLYYAGVRVDGAAVIKKKQAGTYYTLVYVPNVYPGTYDSASHPDLIPIHRWLGIRLDTETLANGTVRLILSLDNNNNGGWTEIARAIDAGGSGNTPITAPGYAGIRTDFMDVSFENFKITTL